MHTYLNTVTVFVICNAHISKYCNRFVMHTYLNTVTDL